MFATLLHESDVAAGESIDRLPVVPNEEKANVRAVQRLQQFHASADMS